MDSFGRAFGAGMAGGAFDPAQFIKKPQVILRAVAFLLALLVWSCIDSGGWYAESVGSDVCLFARSNGTCSFGVAVAVFSFLASIVFVAIEVYFERVSSVQLRKRIVVGDLAASGAFCFFWALAFVVLLSKWMGRDLPDDWVYNSGPPGWTIFFALCSAAVWGGLTYFAYLRYQEGAANAFAPSYEQDFAATGGAAPYGYAGGPPGGSESYQEPPFSATNQAGGQYQQPAY